jgi:hypothetical protein
VYTFAIRFWCIEPDWLTENGVPHALPGGLEGIMQGIQEQKAERVRGEKLVYWIKTREIHFMT